MPFFRSEPFSMTERGTIMLNYNEDYFLLYQKQRTDLLVTEHLLIILQSHLRKSHWIEACRRLTK